MKIIMKTVVGSHLYGTNTEDSDMDYAGVYLPDAKDILLCREPKVIMKSTGQADEKNTQGDVDQTYYPLHRFLNLLAKSDTMAMDLFFSPMAVSEPEWDFIKKNACHILCHSCESYLGYMRRQSSRYGVKAIRVQAVQDNILFLKKFLTHETLASIKEEWLREVYPYNLHNQYDSGHLTVVGRSFPWGAKIGLCLEQLIKIRNKYGARTEAAVTGDGIDWKAVHHAIRAGEQIVEYLETHKMTFPRPNADWLRQIKLGGLDFDACSIYLDEIMKRIEEVLKSTTLPRESNRQWIEETVMHLYRQQILNEIR